MCQIRARSAARVRLSARVKKPVLIQSRDFPRLSRPNCEVFERPGPALRRRWPRGFAAVPDAAPVREQRRHAARLARAVTRATGEIAQIVRSPWDVEPPRIDRRLPPLGIRPVQLTPLVIGQPPAHSSNSRCRTVSSRNVAKIEATPLVCLPIILPSLARVGACPRVVVSKLPCGCIARPFATVIGVPAATGARTPCTLSRRCHKCRIASNGRHDQPQQRALAWPLARHRERLNKTGRTGRQTRAD